LAERREKVIKLIYDNPGFTGNELYKQSISQGFGIKKSDFYQILRIIRKLPEPTIEEKRKATPIRYRKPEPKVKPIKEIKDLPIIKKKGAYGIVFIEAKDDKGNEQEFWVKYETKKSVREQIEKIKKKYKIKIESITFKGLGTYAEYIDAQFEKLLKSVGIDL